MPAPPPERPSPPSSSLPCHPERSEGPGRTPGSPQPAQISRRPSAILAPLLLTLGILLAYSNIHDAPFVFDDRPAILANPSLDSFISSLSPPRDGGTVAGRPLLNLTFYLNRQLSGTHAWSYHALNLLIHLAATLTLHALLLRTLRNLGLKLPPSTCEAVAVATASLWSLHPLATAAVTYTAQRAESLAALFILLSLSTFSSALSPHGGGVPPPRGLSAPPRPQLTPTPSLRRLRLLAANPPILLTLAVLFCLAGQLTKETAAVTPLLILLYDRAVLSGSFLRALRARPLFYTALAATWLVLAYLVATNSARANTAGFATPIAPLDYALTQTRALTLYLKLALWPTPLVFDYGTPLDRTFVAVAPFLLLLTALLVSAFLLTRHRPAARCLLLTFLLLLAPTTLVPIATQTIAEHRFYLPLACLLLALILLLAHLLPRNPSLLLLLLAPLALALASLTHARNHTYASALTLWTDTAQKRPENTRAHNNAGIELARAARPSEAARHYELALGASAQPDAELHHNYATVLLQLDRPAEAIEHFKHAVRLEPAAFPSQLSLATTLAAADRPAEALAAFARAENLSPLPASALVTYAALLAQTGQLPAAIDRYRAALALTPTDARLHYNLGLALARTNDLPAAIAAWRDCLRLDERHLPARVNLANALLLTRRIDEAITEYEAALRLDPANPTARQNLARARALR